MLFRNLGLPELVICGSGILLVALVFLVVWLIKRATSGPDKELKEDTAELIIRHELWGQSEVRNVVIHAIGSCPEISPTAVARGVESAYIVRYSLELYDESNGQWQSRQMLEALIYKQDGDWKQDSSAKCP